MEVELVDTPSTRKGEDHAPHRGDTEHHDRRPGREVFAFIADPQEFSKAMQATVMGRHTTISDIETSPDGVVTSYKVTSSIGIGYLHYDLQATTTRVEHVPNERIVERNSFGSVETDTLVPSGAGTLYTHTSEVTTRVPLLDKVEVLVATRGEGLERGLDEFLSEVKTLLAA